MSAKAEGFLPLRGVRVLDLGKVLAGPTCSQCLADLGADVIKVEPTGTGDDTRGWPPFAGDGRDGAIFLSVNRNKRSVAVDLKTPEGREIVGRLLDTADIFLESYREGTIDRLGFGYEQVRARRPGIIYVSISGYGRTGPLSDLPGYDMMLQAASGIMGITGEKGGMPVRSPFSPLDQTTGLWAVIGILAALRERDRTGEGRFLEVSLFDTAMAFLAYSAQTWWLTGEPPRKAGSGHESLCPYQAFQAADDYIMLGVGSDRLWQRLCAAAGLDAHADDPRYRTNADRVRNFEATVALVGDRLRRKTVAEWVAILTAAGVPNAPINPVETVLAFPHVADRGIVQPYQHPRYGALNSISIPLRTDGQDRRVRMPPPMLGEHTQDVLLEAGFTSEQIDDWVERRVVAVGKQVPAGSGPPGSVEQG